MEISEFYNTAKDYAEQIRQRFSPIASIPGAALSVIEAPGGELYIGTIALGLNDDGKPVILSSQASAMTALTASGKTIAAKIITINLDDLSTASADDETADILLAASAENYNCEIVTAENTSKTIMELKGGGAADAFFSGFDDGAQDEDVQSENDFADGVQIDESNPFYEPPKEDKPPEDVLAPQTPPPAAEEEAQQEEDSDQDDAQDGAPEDNADDKKNKNTLSKGDLLKQAKKRKKVARANFNFRKKM